MTIPGLRAIAHWALKVSDLDRSLAFYRDTLGFTEMMRLHHDNGDTWLVYLRITDTQFVELFPGGEGSRGSMRASTRRRLGSSSGITRSITSTARTASGGISASGKPSVWRRPARGCSNTRRTTASR